MSIKCNAHARIALFGVPFSLLDKESALGELDQAVISKSGKTVCTANADFLVQAREDLELRKILCKADWVWCDGTPIKWLSRLYGPGIQERLAGSDMIPHIMGLAQQKSYRVFILGGKEEANELACQKIRRDFPGIGTVGGFGPPWAPLDDMPHEEINQHINAFKPDILLVCLGCPKQEKWIERNKHEWDVGVSIGLGACVDFIAGWKTRAPVWMRKSGLEWVYRLGQEPQRLAGRYLKDFIRMGRFLIQEFKYRRYYGRAVNCEQNKLSVILHFDAESKTLGIQPSGYVDAMPGLTLIQIREHLCGEHVGNVRLDASRISGFTSQGFGFISDLWRLSKEFDFTLEIVQSPDWLKEMLTTWRWDELMNVMDTTSNKKVDTYLRGRNGSLERSSKQSLSEEEQLESLKELL